MQVLAQVLGQDLQEKATQIPESEIQDNYKKNDAAYQEADLQRLFIPHGKQLEPPKEKLSDEETKKRQDEADEAMKKEAEALHTRAASGEDFDKLQQEAFTTGGLKANPPSTKLGKVRRSSLPADQGAVFDLKSGEVSQLISGPNGYFVYKVGEKDTLPLEKVHEEIHNALRQQKMQDSMQAVQQLSNPVLDEKYFGEGSAGPQQTPAQPGAVKPPAKVPESGPK